MNSICTSIELEFPCQYLVGPKNYKSAHTSLIGILGEKELGWDIAPVGAYCISIQSGNQNQESFHTMRWCT